MELVNGLLTIIFNLIFFLGSVLTTALLFNANSSKSQNLVDIMFNRASLRSPRQYNVVFVHYRHENIVYQFVTCTYIYCWFVRDVMAAMLMVKNKSISICCKLNSIFVVLTNNMAGMSRGCKPRILYVFCFQMLGCAYQTRVKMAAHVIRAITLTFVSAQIVLRDIPAQVGNN